MIVKVEKETLEELYGEYEIEPSYSYLGQQWIPPEERKEKEKWYSPIVSAMFKPVAEKVSPAMEKVLKERAPDITYAIARGLAPQMHKIVFYAVLPIAISIFSLGILYFALKRREK